MSGGGSGHHVRGAGANGRRRDHDLPAPARPREAERGEGHGLLVLSAPGGQLVANRLERLRETGHVPVTEDSEHAREQPLASRLRLHPLIAEVAHERLSHRESYRPRCHLFLQSCVGRASPDSPAPRTRPRRVNPNRPPRSAHRPAGAAGRRSARASRGPPRHAGSASPSPTGRCRDPDPTSTCAARPPSPPRAPYRPGRTGARHRISSTPGEPRLASGANGRSAVNRRNAIVPSCQPLAMSPP